MTEYYYTSNFKIRADLHPERVRPLVKRLESVSLARLPSGLVSRPPESIPPDKQHTIMRTVQVREEHFLICYRRHHHNSTPHEGYDRNRTKKALLPGLVIYGKIEPPHEICPCLLVSNTIPKERFIITGRVQLAPARRARG